jgi:hypothetical protein
MLVRTLIIPPVSEAQPQIVGLGFITICLLGAIAGIRPSACSISPSHRAKQLEKDPYQESGSLKMKYPRRGHHYTCDDFSTHVLNIGENVFCAGCTGLALGAGFAMIGSFFYFFVGVPVIAAEFVFWIGFLGVTTGIVQHKIYRILVNTSGFFRFLLNIFFVNGAFLLLITADQLAGSFVVDSFILLIILFWIYTRIVMSRTEHQRICSQCKTELCHN